MFRKMFREIACWALIPLWMLLLELAATIAWGWFGHWVIATLCAVLFAATVFGTWFIATAETSNCTGSLGLVVPMVLAWMSFALLNGVAVVVLAIRWWLT